VTQPPDGDCGIIMRAMELAGSSDTLARILRTTSRQVIRWMLGKDVLSDEAREQIENLQKMSSDDLARLLHISRDELDLRARRRS
jgi:DNA-binding transcriptional regulator YiaG